MPENARSRLGVALDVDSAGKALKLAIALKPYVGFFKLGFEFMTATLIRLATQEKHLAEKELEDLQELFRQIQEQLFWDGKFCDIPNTVGKASRPVSGIGIKMFNIHCLGGSKMMKNALAAAEDMKKISPNGQRPRILGVTLLTSLDYDDLVELGIMSELNIADQTEREDTIRLRRERFVSNLAWLAQENGLDGVIASPQETAVIRAHCQPEFGIWNPGIRPAGSDTGDQKRTDTPGGAIRNGATGVIVGRPITTDTPDPVEAACKIVEEIGKALTDKET